VTFRQGLPPLCGGIAGNANRWVVGKIAGQGKEVPAAAGGVDLWKRGIQPKKGMQTYHTLGSSKSCHRCFSRSSLVWKSSQESRRRESLEVGNPKGSSSPASLKGFRRKRTGCASSWQFPVPVTNPVECQRPQSVSFFPSFFLGSPLCCFLSSSRGSGIRTNIELAGVALANLGSCCHSLAAQKESPAST